MLALLSGSAAVTPSIAVEPAAAARLWFLK
jgi:hypothetical protein